MAASRDVTTAADMDNETSDAVGSEDAIDSVGANPTRSRSGRSGR